MTKAYISSDFLNGIFGIYSKKIFPEFVVEVYKISKWEVAGTTMDRDNKLIERGPYEKLSNRYEFIGEKAG